MVGSDIQSLPPSPFAKHRGELALGSSEIDCYVLDTGERVLAMRAVVRSLFGIDGSDLASYIGTQALRPYVNSRDVIRSAVEFHIPGTQFTGRGITAESFLEVCGAYVSAMACQPENLTSRQIEIAMKSSILLGACAKTGLISLIDEATGYQYERAEDALRLKLRAYISDELRAWEKTFPDQLWEEFGRLTHWKGSLHSRPKWWGKLVMELIYDALDPDVALTLRTTKPNPSRGQNYHQWLTGTVGLAALVSHLHQVIGIAKTCETMPELREKVAFHYRKQHRQPTKKSPSQQDNE